MKRLFSFILVLILASFVMPQSQSASYREVYLDFGTLANSVTETGYIYLDAWEKIDSAHVVAFARNETDVDSIDIYPGNMTFTLNAQGKQTNKITYFSATPTTATVTLNIADAGTGRELILSSNATQYGSAFFRGVDALKVVTRGATSGNDTTDPNRFIVGLQIWGTLK